jgi:ADP-ribose pyrophosphatase
MNEESEANRVSGANDEPAAGDDPSPDEERLLERTVDRRVLHSGRYLTFRVDTIEDAEGRRHTRELVIHPGAVTILPVVDGAVLMVRQFRTPVERVLMELPAGTLDRMPDGSIEDPAIAAPRELEEETGYRAETWRKLATFYTAPGFATEEMHLYLATDLTPVPGYAGPETDERIDLRHVPWREAVQLAADGRIQDAKSICGLFWLDRLVASGELTV